METKMISKYKVTFGRSHNISEWKSAIYTKPGISWESQGIWWMVSQRNMKNQEIRLCHTLSYAISYQNSISSGCDFSADCGTCSQYCSQGYQQNTFLEWDFRKGSFLRVFRNNFLSVWGEKIHIQPDGHFLLFIFSSNSLHSLFPSNSSLQL